MSSLCPHPDQLRAFSLGTLTEGVLERVAEHVLACPDCEQTLNAIDDCCDGLLSELRTCHFPPSVPAAVPAQWIERAGRLVQHDHAGQDEAAVDPGRRYARLLSQGPCRLGKFHLETPLGVGSFGYVFRARDADLDRTVAIKVQRAGSLCGEEEVNRFVREARSVASLQHPGIVALHEISQTEDGVCFLVYEFIEGETLEQWLLEHRPDFQTIARQVASMADALHYAHEQGVVHRDIKPANILIDRKGLPHIMDFGLAKRDAGEPQSTPDGQLMGTPAYMSPEQARGDSTGVGPRSDVYSLGVILYEMLTAERPFQGNRRMLLLQVLEDEPRAPRQLNEHIPRDLETICLKAISKVASRRYATAREFAEDLRRYLNGDAILARSSGRLERLSRWCRRYPLAAVLLLAITLGSALGLWYLSSLSEYFVQQTALDSARMEAEMLEEMNAFYSELVDRLDGRQVPITDKYLSVHGALPLPATFIIDAGERISSSESGMQVRLYSRYPWRVDGGPKDEFEREALRVLEQDPERPVHRFTEQRGQRMLLYATAQRMELSCVKCHNQSDRSPKRDWKIGQVVGVLKIVRPLDREIARTRKGLLGAFVLMGSSSALLLVAVGGAITGARLRSLRRKKTP